jgi:acetylornithine deacetylase
MHLDVVPADPEDWNVDPFKLTRDGDKLHGRGTTDCLGHVALIARLLYELGRTKPQLKNSIVAVFIAAEEGGETGVGVDMVVKNGKMESCKQGPVYWVDSADSNPCCGTCGTMSWSLTAKGRLFHSGFPHKGINAIELVSDAVAQVQERFYDDFPPLDEEIKYQFAAGSNMKPTQMECKKGSLNQICAEATMHGDIRCSPFHDVADVQKAVEKYVQEMNDGIDLMPTRGPYSKYQLDDSVEIQNGERRKAELVLKWSGDIDTFRSYEGIACSLDSPGHKALVQATRETLGSTSPFSVNGSLPLVRMMQKAGFDLQLVGFGLMKVYHGVDEYCLLSGMKSAYLILLRVIALLESQV